MCGPRRPRRRWVINDIRVPPLILGDERDARAQPRAWKSAVMSLRKNEGPFEPGSVSTTGNPAESLREPRDRYREDHHDEALQDPPYICSACVDGRNNHGAGATRSSSTCVSAEGAVARLRDGGHWGCSQRDLRHRRAEMPLITRPTSSTSRSGDGPAGRPVSRRLTDRLTVHAPRRIACLDG